MKYTNLSEVALIHLKLQVNEFVCCCFEEVLSLICKVSIVFPFCVCRWKRITGEGKLDRKEQTCICLENCCTIVICMNEKQREM